MDATGHLPGRETCPVCATEFGCSAAQPGCPCWCAEVTVPETALHGLAAVHQGCLCPTCLNNVAGTQSAG